MKKTTIELDDDVYRELKVRAAQSGMTMRELVASALRAAFGTDEGSRLRQRVKFPIIESSDSNHRVTSEDVYRIINELDEEEALEHARLGGR